MTRWRIARLALIAGCIVAALLFGFGRSDPEPERPSSTGSSSDASRGERSAAPIGSGEPSSRPAATTDLPPLAERGELLVLGDSLALGAERAGSLLALLRTAGWEPTIVADEGQATPWGTDRLEAMRSVPAVVVVVLGTNRWSTVGTFPDDIADLVATATAKGAQRLLWITPVAVDEPGRYDDKQAVLRTAAATDPRLVIGEWGQLAEANPRWFGTDGIHYTAEGYTQLARFIEANAAPLADP